MNRLADIRLGLLSVAVMLAVASCADDSSSGISKDAGHDHDSGREPDGAVLSCESADLEFGRWIKTAVAERQTCTTVEDCEKIAPSVVCESTNVRLGNCDVPISVSDSEDFEAQLESYSNELCDGVEHGCSAGPSCPETDLACIDSKCVLRAVEP